LDGFGRGFAWRALATTGAITSRRAPSGSATVAVSFSLSAPAASNALRNAGGSRNVAVVVPVAGTLNAWEAIFAPLGAFFACGVAPSSPVTAKGLKFSIATCTRPWRTGPWARETVTAVAAPKPGGRGAGGAGTASGALVTVVVPAALTAVAVQA
jgi:hypothetical protein